VKEAYRFPLRRGFQLQLVSLPKKDIHEGVKVNVEEIFRSSGKNLFDAEVVVLQVYQKDLLVVAKASYKECFASMHDKAVREILGLYPLAVCGRTISDGAVLLGRRARGLATNEGMFECIPSGGIDASRRLIDPQAALLKEFVEETRLSLLLIESIEPTCLIWTPKEGVFDLCFDIKLSDNVILSKNEECEEFLWWRPGDPMKEVLPASQLLLKQSDR
jgi:hypothetical protein